VKQAFSKGISKLIDIDPVLGPYVLEKFKVFGEFPRRTYEEASINTRALMNTSKNAS
jgi:hypothetical protein